MIRNCYPIMKVSAVYLSYNPDVDLLSKSLARALDSCEHVYIYDNNSMIKPIFNDERITVIYGDENIGVSGLNYIISLAFSEHSDFIIILDQDSILPLNFVSDAVRQYKSTPGVYCPVVYDRVRAQTEYIDDSILRYVTVDSAIGSGLIISKEICSKVGKFDESFFLDCVDIDLCFRFKNKGVGLYSDTKSIMYHSIGDSFIRFLNFKVSNHSPLRHYLYYRNSFRLIMKSYVPMGWKIKQVIKMLCQWIFYSVFSTSRKDNFMAFLLAILHFSGSRAKPIEFINK